MGPFSASAMQVDADHDGNAGMGKYAQIYHRNPVAGLCENSSCRAV